MGIKVRESPAIAPRVFAYFRVFALFRNQKDLAKKNFCVIRAFCELLNQNWK